MFNKAELIFIKSILSQVNFKAGQSDHLTMTENILKKIQEYTKEEVNKK